MKFWRKSISRISLKGKGDNDGRVLDILFDDDAGRIVFEEMCDSFYAIELPPDQAKAALLEAVEWIDKVAGAGEADAK